MQSRVYQVFVLPITFKTVSFHHRAHYSLRISSQGNEQILAAKVLSQFQAPPRMEVDSRSGNITGIGGSITQVKHFWSQKFPIDYNDQFGKFAAGLWLRLDKKDSTPLQIAIELYRIDVDIIREGRVLLIEEPEGVKVSQELLYLSLEQNKEAFQPFNYRKLIFPTSQYISFIDVCVLVAKIGWQPELENLQKNKDKLIAGSSGLDCCCLITKKPADPERILQEVYSIAIQEKLDSYSQLSSILKYKIKQYLWLRQNRRQSIKTGGQFQRLFVRRKITDLAYVGIKNHLDSDQRMQSTLPIIQGKNFIQLLCDNYESELHELGQHIVEQSALIEHNIRAIFQRVIQICFAMAEGLVKEVSLNEKRRVKQFMQTGEFKLPSKLEEGIPQEFIYTQKRKVANLLTRFENYTKLEQRQPLLLVSSQYENIKLQGKALDISRTLTILVHGFRGNEYDLSKLKSYLNLFHGFTHFYPLKSIAGAQTANASISKLAQLAGEEISRYLQLHSMIRTVNVVGFSMGGVIARAMMKHLKPHFNKFNLLLTLASPHLGMREIESCLVRTGLLYMRRVAKIESIQDLNVQRTNDNNRLLVDLAGCESILCFKWIVLVGSKEDEYVPLYSSLCDYKGDNEHIKELNTRFGEQRKDVVRCLAKVECEESLWDKVTMRKAHISLLEDDSFIRLLVVRLETCFTCTR